jgi:hypothetical protein
MIAPRRAAVVMWAHRLIGRLRHLRWLMLHASSGVHAKLLDLSNIVFGVALALAASNAKSVFTMAGVRGDFYGFVLFIAIWQICVGVILWMVFAQQVLLFQQSPKARSDLYVIPMAVPLIFVALYYATQGEPKVSDYSANAIPSMGAPSFVILTAFFLWLSGLARLLSTDRAASVGLRRRIRRSSKSLLGVGVATLALLAGVLLPIESPWIYWPSISFIFILGLARFIFVR